jgi:hypothetical protein
MAKVRLDIPENQVVALIRQLSPAAKEVVLHLLISELASELGELEALDALEDLMAYGEAFELWETPEFWGGEEEGMTRQQFLAAETFYYSYANYDNHLGIGNIRFDKLMPDNVDTLERAEQEGWDDARLAQALEVEEEHVGHWRRSYQRAKAVVDAPTSAESFRRGVRFSIEDAIEEGLSDEREIQRLVTQICYRAADLAYLLDMRQERLADYSAELRKTSEADLDWITADDD